MALWLRSLCCARIVTNVFGGRIHGFIINNIMKVSLSEIYETFLMCEPRACVNCIVIVHHVFMYKTEPYQNERERPNYYSKTLNSKTIHSKILKRS